MRNLVPVFLFSSLFFCCGEEPDGIKDLPEDEKRTFLTTADQLVSYWEDHQAKKTPEQLELYWKEKQQKKNVVFAPGCEGREKSDYFVMLSIDQNRDISRGWYHDDSARTVSFYLECLDSATKYSPELEDYYLYSKVDLYQAIGEMEKLESTYQQMFALGLPFFEEKMKAGFYHHMGSLKDTLMWQGDSARYYYRKALEQYEQVKKAYPPSLTENVNSAYFAGENMARLTYLLTGDTLIARQRLMMGLDSTNTEASLLEQGDRLIKELHRWEKMNFPNGRASVTENKQ